jgi:hypothetical protein
MSDNYPTPQIYNIAKHRLRRASLAAMKELIDRYRLASDEGMVAMTDRQMAAAIGTSRRTAGRALSLLDGLQFVSRETSSFEEKHKPSRYTLNMLPFKGEPAKHEYALGEEWNHAIRRKVKEDRFDVDFQHGELTGTVRGVPESRLTKVAGGLRDIGAVPIAANTR